MYEELVKKLRYCGNAIYCSHCPYWEGCEGSKEDLNKAAYAIEELQSLLYLMKSNADWLSEKIPKWIPVTERLPDDHIRVLVVNDDSKFMVSEYTEDDWWYQYSAYDIERWDTLENGIITHWMPLPEPPKEET